LITKLASRKRAATDVALTILFFFVFRVALASLDASNAGSLAVLVTLGLVTARLRHLGMSWRELGLANPDSAGRVVILAVAAYLSSAIAVVTLANPLADALGWPELALEKLGNLEGNLPHLIFMIVVIGWGAAAIGEELLFRGFLLNRIKLIFVGWRFSALLAVVGQATVFGLGHLYLGNRAALSAGIVGLVFGGFYFVSRENIWPLIAAHGTADTISLYAIYAGAASDM